MRTIDYPRDTGDPNFPHLLRRETGLMEFVCIHGVGHPAASSIRFMDSISGPGNKGTWGVHGCDGCCTKFPMPDVQYTPPRLDVVYHTQTVEK